MANQIKQLLWRAGFGPSPQEWLRYRQMNPVQAYSELRRQAVKPKPLPMPEFLFDGTLPDINKETVLELREKSIRQVIEVNTAWMERMANPAEPALLERMTLFWHGHFACRMLDGRLAVQYLNTIRKHALGNFKDLLLGIAQTPAMIRYLNNQQNRKQQPNENFARELMELFTLGRGQYTERDIKEAARAFTGWSSNLRGEYVFRAFQHDTGQKTIFGKSGTFGGEEVIDLILKKPEAAEFIVRKIYRYFVHPSLDEQRVQDLSRTFFASNYDIGELMESIFSSEWFYAPGNQGKKIKSPVDFAVGMTRQLELQFPDPRSWILLQKGLGQQLINPPNVAGWPGGRSWIDNSTLMLRLNIPSYLFGLDQINFRPKAGLKAMQEEEDVRKLSVQFPDNNFNGLVSGRADQADFQALRDFLIVNGDHISYDFLKRALQQNGPKAVTEMGIRLMSLPEYQIC